MKEDEQISPIISEREFHQVPTSAYWLPKDEAEQRRLADQHFAFKELLGGNIIPCVANNLDLNSGVSILDIGCGAGAWIKDTISDYPNCTYYGCDLVDVTDKETMPKQFVFTIGNVVEGLPYEDNTFDFVHMRLLVLSLREEEWPLAIKEAVRVTKPRGYLQFVESSGDVSKLYILFNYIDCF
ncbi:S-adenosyl-L-methionine-dependent methyltransferase [Rhizopus microsporus ATCC 52813]|uniref:S-adenosyl-L-methionine-dependent methyltransferase n=1 Tax=Rhizopus microsporus ATCC 52813 TaxID=1340429 RepID=A0A2G4SKR0_RHIZD|nr:S-adenosyl-L-methionine-dependent methyltransferase [Rhizopus microsporus ATCC 52813]PHZ09360.1 S-adenosyl-L-methionine-dependent methyltransferase [Rhizopus microsporus ATCC 52813]